MSWKTTELKNNALSSNSYLFTITGLTASTKYRYRSYFIVDGVEYFGDIKTGTTANINITVPIVETELGTTTDDRIITKANSILDKGGAPILEYGLLYTSLQIHATTTNLVYESVGNNIYVKKESICSDTATIPPTFLFAETITGLTEGTTYYYRAFARNASGSGYGEIKNIATTGSQTVLYTLNIIQSGTVNGIVAKFPLPINGTKYVSGENVRLTAVDTPRMGSFWYKWVIDGITYSSPTDNPITIQMNSDKDVFVYFGDLT